MLVGEGGDDGIRWRAGECLHHLFEQRCDLFAAAAGDGGHPAVDTGGESLGYAALEARANRLARYLRRHGVRPGDRVALLLDRSAHAYAALLGVLKAGAAYVPLDASMPRDRVGYIIADAGVSAIVSVARYREALAGLDVGGIFIDEAWDEVAAESAGRVRLAEEDAPADALCYVIYTSGSTGRPKGVAINHSSICNFIRVAGEVYGYRPGDRVYQGLTLAFDFAVEELWVPLIAGATLVPSPAEATLVGSELGEFLASRRITALCCVPTLLATVDRLPGSLRFLLLSGEACPPDLAARWHAPGRRILNAYGPTEATVTATWCELRPGEPVTIGRPLPTYAICILDPAGAAELPDGEVGEIGIGGIGLARGYVNREDLTAKVFIADFLGIPHNPSRRIYRTGDLGRIDEHGMLECLGRIDTQVKIRGYRIEVSEIESVLLQMPQIAQAVVGTTSPEPGAMELVAYYTLRQPGDGPSQAPSQADIAEALRARLPRYMIPAYVEELPSLPMLASNKVDRKRLPPPSGTRLLAGGQHYLAPRTRREEVLAAALAEVLGVERVSVRDNFFADLGAHSFLMARFCARARERLGDVNIAMRDVYLHPTVAELATSLSAGGGDAAAVEEAGEYRQASGGEYWLCGLLQAATYVAIVLVTVRVLIEAIAWNAQAGGFSELYRRCCISGALLFLAYAAVPIALKWLLVGRWKAERIPIWSLAYYRFWLAKLLIQTNPLALFRGSPLYNVYLRLLGARIGANAFIDARLPPVCTDLIAIGAGAVIRKDALLPGYKAERGWIRTGRIRIGSDALIGNASVLDIDTAMGEGAQLGHCSSLQEGETVPPGRRYHGSPAVETQVDYLGVESRACGRARRILYSAAQIAALALLYLPAPFVLIHYWARHEIHADPLSPSWTHGLLVFSALVFAAVLVLRVVSSTLLPGLLARVFRDGTAYTLYGVRYGVLRLIQRLSNSYFLNALFGDSSAIVHYLKAVGYRMPRIVQTGSNFGMVQRHDVPTFCDVGMGTMVADGLSMINVLNSASSFRVCRASIGENNYLGNLIVYPPYGRTGRNCLLATKTMIPIDGRVREDVGLLGSPAFEIPRAVARDRAFNRQVGEEAQRRGLRAKNRHNLVTALLFLFFQWLYFYLAVALVHAGVHLDDFHGMTPWAVMAVLFPAFSILYFCALERASLGFGRIPPQTVSIYDAGFWRVERYWKLSESLVHHMFKGTPIRNVVTRLRGCRLGRKVFDDGALITETTLMEIGDHCTLNEAVLLQSHSLEEGVFKSDWVRIGAGCTVGCNALVHYGVVCGEGAVVDPDSFVMKGETVAAGSCWRGNPATGRASAPAAARQAASGQAAVPDLLAG